MSRVSSLDLVLDAEASAPAVPASPWQIVEVIASLLAAGAAPDDELPDRVCQALTEFLPPDRAALFGRDADGEARWLGGAHIRAEAVNGVRALTAIAAAEPAPRLVGGTLDASVALSGASDTLLVVPVVWSGELYGILLADCGGARLALSDDQVEALLGACAEVGMALAACAAGMRRQREQERRHRLDFARELHDGVVQQLVGMKLLLEDEQVGEGRQDACREVVEQALAELRGSLCRHISNGRAPSARSLEAELQMVRDRPATALVEEGLDLLPLLPRATRVLAERVLFEGLQNVRKHAEPGRVELRVRLADGVVGVTVRNDGVVERSPHGGLGLRLLAVEALREGGLVDGARDGREAWTLTATIPLG